MTLVNSNEQSFYHDVGIQDACDSCSQHKLCNSHVCKGYRESWHGNEKRPLYTTASFGWHYFEKNNIGTSESIKTCEI